MFESGIVPLEIPISFDSTPTFINYASESYIGLLQILKHVSYRLHMTSKSGTTNEIYGMTRLATTTESHTSFFLNDGRGSVVQTTNAQGATTSWKSYSAFGEIEASSTLGELPTYGYNAEEQHPTTGLTYLRFRYYEAKTSTFGVQDTYLGNIFSPLTLNRYLYCLSNPVNYVDPTGHKGIGNILLNAANKVINQKKKHGGTQINNDSYANDPGQKTIDKPAWEAYDPSLTPDQRHQRSVANATLNEMLWHYELSMKSGDASIIAWHLAMAEKMKKEYEAFYCGNAPNISTYIYNREAAIRYAWNYSDSDQGIDSEIPFYVSLLSRFNSFRNPSYPTYEFNCANFVSQALEAGGIAQNDDWHARRDILTSAISILLGPPVFTKGNWDVTYSWSIADDQFKYFSNQANGFTSKPVINIQNNGSVSNSSMEEVSFTGLSSSALLQTVQPGDLMYF